MHGLQVQCHRYRVSKRANQPLTFATGQNCGVGQKQQHVIYEVLKHGRVNMEVCGQVLRADGRATDHSRQHLAHGCAFQQTPEINNVADISET